MATSTFLRTRQTLARSRSSSTAPRARARLRSGSLRPSRAEPGGLSDLGAPSGEAVPGGAASRSSAVRLLLEDFASVRPAEQAGLHGRIYRRAFRLMARRWWGEVVVAAHVAVELRDGEVAGPSCRSAPCDRPRASVRAGRICDRAPLRRHLRSVRRVGHAPRHGAETGAVSAFPARTRKNDSSSFASTARCASCATAA